MSRMHSLARSIVYVLAALGVAAYGGAAVVTVADVLGRPIGLPVEGVVDLVQLFVVAGAWLVMPYAFMVGAHVGVDFLVKMLPGALKTPLALFSTAASLLLVALMLWYGLGTFIERASYGDSSQQLDIPMAWYWYPLIVGLAASLLGAILEAIAVLRGDGHE